MESKLDQKLLSLQTLDDVIETLTLTQRDIKIRMKRDQSQFKESALVTSGLLNCLDFIFELLDSHTILDLISKKFPMLKIRAEDFNHQGHYQQQSMLDFDVKTIKSHSEWEELHSQAESNLDQQSSPKTQNQQKPQNPFSVEATQIITIDQAQNNKQTLDQQIKSLKAEQSPDFQHLNQELIQQKLDKIIKFHEQREEFYKSQVASKQEWKDARKQKWQERKERKNVFQDYMKHQLEQLNKNLGEVRNYSLTTVNRINDLQNSQIQFDKKLESINTDQRSTNFAQDKIASQKQIKSTQMVEVKEENKELQIDEKKNLKLIMDKNWIYEAILKQINDLNILQLSNQVRMNKYKCRTFAVSNDNKYLYLPKEDNQLDVLLLSNLQVIQTIFIDEGQPLCSYVLDDKIFFGLQKYNQQNNFNLDESSSLIYLDLKNNNKKVSVNRQISQLISLDNNLPLKIISSRFNWEKIRQYDEQNINLELSCYDINLDYIIVAYQKQYISLINCTVPDQIEQSIRLSEIEEINDIAVDYNLNMLLIATDTGIYTYLPDIFVRQVSDIASLSSICLKKQLKINTNVHSSCLSGMRISNIVQLETYQQFYIKTNQIATPKAMYLISVKDEAKYIVINLNDIDGVSLIQKSTKTLNQNSQQYTDKKLQEQNNLREMEERKQSDIIKCELKNIHKYKQIMNNSNSNHTFQTTRIDNIGIRSQHIFIRDSNGVSIYKPQTEHILPLIKSEFKHDQPCKQVLSVIQNMEQQESNLGSCLIQSIDKSIDKIITLEFDGKDSVLKVFKISSHSNLQKILSEFQ
eukprot:403352347